jgi:RHS repeat-associated protein
VQDNDFTIAGEEVDGSTGLQYLRARYYDPNEARFLGRDAFPGWLESPDSQNRYAYGLNNPALYTDPLGLSAGKGGGGGIIQKIFCTVFRCDTGGGKGGKGGGTSTSGSSSGSATAPLRTPAGVILKKGGHADTSSAPHHQVPMSVRAKNEADARGLAEAGQLSLNLKFNSTVIYEGRIVRYTGFVKPTGWIEISNYWW